MLPSSKFLKNRANNRLAAAKEPQKIALIYGAISLGTSLLVTAVRYGLANEISQTGGLRNMGLRSVLETADSVLPMLQMVLMMCLNLGFVAAMMRIARRQFASPKTLKAGAERFWVLLRSRILKGLIYTGMGFVTFYLALGLFMLSPLSNGFMAAAEPLVMSANFDPQMLVDQPEILDSLMPSLIPMLVIYAVLMGAGCLMIFYRYRLVDYLLIDNPRFGASYAMRQSQIFMRGNRMAMFKLDLSFWWYFLLELAASALLYSDVLLRLLHISLPFSDAVLFFGDVILSLGAEFALIWFFKNKLEVTYALAYDAIVPRAKPEEGAVLGNIFQM